MSKRKVIQIPQEEINKQKEIIIRIGQKNDMEYQKTGKQKLAFLQTYGCKQNENDSERLRGMIEEMGYIFTEERDTADLIIYNTCCVRENAELKVFGNLGALKHLKANNPELLIGVCGCMMQQEHIVTQIKRKYKHVDMVFGTHTLYRFPKVLEQAMDEMHTVIDILNIDGSIAEDMPIHRTDKSKAWVSIMYGCNNFCTYCIVPYVRGRERSRDPKDIIEEINKLVDDGCEEITLLGQNVNSYGKDLEQACDFADLLKMVNSIDGLKRIRFMTSHPKDISDKLIETMKICDKLCKHLHLPFQSGNNKVLKLMNRSYTKEQYLEIIAKVKKAIPDIALSSDIIVGFPGENNEDFEDTIDVVRKVEFDTLYTFIYSKRVGTPAAQMEDVLTSDEKQANFNKLLAVQNQISKAKNTKYVGNNYEILIEGLSKNNDKMLTGRTETGKAVNFPGNVKRIGEIVTVKITEGLTWSLNGEIVE